MTGNVVFLAFALAGAQGFSVFASLLALAAFGLGAVAGGRMGAYLHTHRGRLLSLSCTFEVLLIGAAFGVAAAASRPVESGACYVIIVLLGLAMGSAERYGTQAGGSRLNHHCAEPYDDKHLC